MTKSVLETNVALLAVVAVLFTLIPFGLAHAETSPLAGKIIALDAGHGNGETGAVGYCGDIAVPENEVNEAVRAELKSQLEATGAIVHEVEQLPTRKERVENAESVNSDVLISIHHNGSSDTSVDYTKFFVTQSNDKQLANAIYPEMLTALGLDGKGLKSDGYGMTVYGSLPGVLTESYFITNTDEACNYAIGGKTRIGEEAGAMFRGLEAYFGGSSSGGGGKGGGKGRN